MSTYFKDTKLIKEALIKADESSERARIEVGVYDSDCFEKKQLVSKFMLATFRKRRNKK